jgi:hypothetical protein
MKAFVITKMAALSDRPLSKVMIFKITILGQKILIMGHIIAHIYHITYNNNLLLHTQRREFSRQFSRRIRLMEINVMFPVSDFLQTEAVTFHYSLFII